MHIAIHENGDGLDPLNPIRISDRYLAINAVGETLEELRDVQFLRPEGTLDYSVKYLIAGKSLYDFGNGWETVQAGTVLLYRPGEVQSSYSRRTDESDELFLHFSGKAAEEIWSSLGFAGKKLLTIGYEEKVVSLWKSIIAEIVHNGPGSEQMVNGMLIELLSMISRISCCNGQKVMPEKQNIVGTMWDARLSPALQTIHISYDEALTLDGLADACHLSKYYFARLFRKETGMSPYRYVLEVRMQQACRLLLGTDASMAEIAAAVGIPAEASFRSTFRKIVGCSPIEYRKREKAR